jgi:general secretion pathway protein H
MNNSHQRGFTLMEVMVTMVLIGIIATFAVLSLPRSSDAERLASEAKRLAALLELSHQEAILRGEQRGVRFTETGYAFLTMTVGGWLPPENSTLLTEYQLPPGFTLAVWVENRPVDFRDTSVNLPQVLLLSSGEATDFRVVFKAADSNVRNVQSYSLSGDSTGNLRLAPVS